jgi:hypothetical protein
LLDGLRDLLGNLDLLWDLLNGLIHGLLEISHRRGRARLRRHLTLRIASLVLLVLWVLRMWVLSYGLHRNLSVLGRLYRGMSRWAIG